MPESIAQHFLQYAEDLRDRAGGKRLAELSERDQQIWMNVSRELNDLLECCPDNLADPTKARIERFLSWSPFDSTDELILSDRIEQTFKQLDVMSAEDWAEYYRQMDQSMTEDS